MTNPPADSNNLVTWAADATHPEKAAALRTAWAEVLDPELGLNILQLGLIREVEIRDEAVFVRMLLTTPFCPYGPALMENARQKAEKAAEMPATMELSEEVWDPSMMDQDAAAELGFFF